MPLTHLLPAPLWERLDAQSVLIFIAGFLLVADYVKNRAPKNFPPSPPGVPFFGNVFHVDPKEPHIYMKKLAQKYGNVFSLRLGRSRIVVVNGYKMAKEALVNQADAILGRSEDPVFKRINKLYGVVLSSGYRWKQNRRFMLTTLRNFGVGKSSLEFRITEEFKHFQQAIQEEQGRPFDPHFLMNNAVSNIICSIVFGRRFEYSDQRFQELLHLIFEALYLEGTIWAELYNAFPTIMKVLPGRHHVMFADYDKVVEFLRTEIEEHKKHLDPAAPRDFIDCYLEEIEKRKEDVKAEFHEENLSYCLLDLFVAGTETTSTTLRWALLYMMKYPDVQEKVQKEIDAILGRDQPPLMQDRNSLPYTNAVIHEIQRMADIIPLNQARQAIEDMSLGGHFIPKDTAVSINLNSVLFDEEEWEDPSTFKPEHFLDASGKFLRRDAFFVFSAGKRSCVGEPLARMELFLFFTSLLQKFTFLPPEGIEPSLDFQKGITRVPVSFKIRAIPR
ncbi:cytochrome P450 2J6-like [Erpetoichthys calabaricus]|uniref:cytochrome P450 2J6-like n=1 Tax=Erpetoichthys calabaricus TaxID=27687 RepID=UPI0010A04120|nr:cytochrome P450 2J6-like [Erpetoichthys calabaricus]